MQLAGVFFCCVIGASCLLALLSFAWKAHRKNELTRGNFARRSSFSERDRKYALETLGSDSVNQFFLGTSVCGWVIVSLTIASQIGILFMFVEGAEIDLSSDSIDLVYTYKCPRDQVECTNTNDIDWKGWTGRFY